MGIPRVKRENLVDNEIHKLPFLDWLQQQSEDISAFSSVIETLEKEGTQVISLGKINGCLARYTHFNTIQSAYYQIYSKYLKDKQKQANDLYDAIYMDIKRDATNPENDIGKRYAKKGATQEEIRMEAKVHKDWETYNKLLEEIDDLELKVSAQKRNLSNIDKLDITLQVLKKRDEKEIKYLYLE